MWALGKDLCEALEGRQYPWVTPWYLSPLANMQRPAPCLLPCAHCPWYLSPLLPTMRPWPCGRPPWKLPEYLFLFSNLAFPAGQLQRCEWEVEQ